MQQLAGWHCPSAAVMITPLALPPCYHAWAVRLDLQGSVYSVQQLHGMEGLAGER